MPIGDHIRDLRWDRRLNQGELAHRAGIAQNTLSQIELGKTTPSVPTLEKIARGLNVDLSELLLEEEPSPAVHIHEQSSLRAEGTVLRIASRDLQAIIRGAARGEFSEEEAMAAAHEKAETV
jgi:transcriptional regulator with XRE-family HTH domain